MADYFEYLEDSSMRGQTQLVIVESSNKPIELRIHPNECISNIKSKIDKFNKKAKKKILDFKMILEDIVLLNDDNYFIDYFYNDGKLEKQTLRLY